jgi:hypothetical protein
VVCQATSSIGEGVSSIALAPVRALADSALGAVVQLWREWVLTGWTRVPGPRLADDSSAVWQVRSHLLWLTGFVLLLCILAVCVRLVVVRRAEPLLELLRGLVTTVLVVAGSVSLVGILLGFADQYSAWIIARSSPFDPSWTTGPANWLLMAVTSVFALALGVLQIMLMVIRSAVVVLLLGLLPVTAAASTTRWGRQWFEKTAGWLFAFILYKPAAATIYAAGFAMLEQSGDFMSLAGGVAVSLLAVLALPALIKLAVPATAGLAGGGAGGGVFASAAMALGATRSPAAGAATSGGGAAAGPAGAAAGVVAGAAAHGAAASVATPAGRS